MIVPFLNHAPRFSTYTSDGADAATSAISAVRAALASAGWDEPTANTMRSPARADIIRFTVTLARIDATTISFIVKDHAGRLVNNDTLTKQTVPLNTVCNIYCGDAYVFHEINTQTNLWGACVLHREPDPIAEPTPCYFASKGPVNNAGSAFAFLSTTSQPWIGAGAAGAGKELNTWRGPGSAPDHFSAQYSMMFYPLEICESGSWFYGRLPNCLLCDVSQQYGNTFEVPLDETTIGTFRIARSGSVNNFVLAIRIS